MKTTLRWLSLILFAIFSCIFMLVDFYFRYKRHKIISSKASIMIILWWCWKCKERDINSAYREGVLGWEKGMNCTRKCSTCHVQRTLADWGNSWGFLLSFEMNWKNNLQGKVGSLKFWKLDFFELFAKGWEG